KECLDNMEVIPPEVRADFENKIDWLKDKACARRKGLGTPLPWDKEWIIESLGDSTIYMVYYILSELREAGVGPEEFTKPLLDYIILGVDDALKEVPEDRHTLVKKVRRAFEYWYPVDLRTSGKDLVANHLLFFIFHHVAIFEREKWPKRIAVNGYVSLEGQKMSKSKGPLLTLNKAVEMYGADTTRLYILSNAEQIQDVDWKAENVEGVYRHLFRFYRWASRCIAEREGDVGGSKLDNRLDRWMLSRLSYHVGQVREALENLQTRRALQHAFFLPLNDVRWYERRGGSRALFTVADVIIRMMSPFTPHVCEELWSMYGDGFVSTSPYPEQDWEEDPIVEMGERLVVKTLEDVTDILKVVKIDSPKRVLIYTADDIKYDVMREALRLRLSGEFTVSMLMQNIKESSPKERMKEIATFVGELSKQMNTIDEYEAVTFLDGWTRGLEKEVLEDAREFLSREIGCEVIIDPPFENKKARQAKPLRPAIVIE
ncbi:MAG: class I tRNA ligase family protein, partial [Methermicoccaceae archaeon]